MKPNSWRKNLMCVCVCGGVCNKFHSKIFQGNKSQNVAKMLLENSK